MGKIQRSSQSKHAKVPDDELLLDWWWQKSGKPINGVVNGYVSRFLCLGVRKKHQNGLREKQIQALFLVSSVR